MKRKSFPALRLISIFFVFLLYSIALAEELPTPAEEVNYTQYSQYEEVARFLSIVDHLSEKMTVQIIRVDNQ